MANTEEKRRKKIKVVASTVFAAIFIASIVVIGLIFSEKQENTVDEEWWKTSTIYHIYVPSFKDSDNDTFGDLNGVKTKIEYIKNLGIDTVWLSPFYENGKDNDTNQNYDWDDIMDHRSVGHRFGTDDDLNQLLSELEENEIKVILEFIPNHTSDEHEWFQASCNKQDGKEDYYVWRNKTSQDGPPTNWKMVGSDEEGSAWKCDHNCTARADECYLHNFLEEMPDLNLRNGAVIKEIEDIMKYWLSRPSVSGFHISNIDLLIEDDTKEDMVTPDIEATTTFLNGLFKLAEEYEDTTKRLFLLELVKGEQESNRAEQFQELTSSNVQIPFNFGNIDWIEKETAMWKAGIEIKNSVNGYLQSLESEESETLKWPFWEMNNYELTTAKEGFMFGRIFKDTQDVVMMMTLLLPGTSVVYYGDEIGMSGSLDELNITDIKDPFAMANCDPDDIECYQSKSRDTMRTPMQWSYNEKNDMWLNYLQCQNYSNVKDEEAMNEEDRKWKRNHLEMFKRLTALKKFPAFEEGHLFYPWQDQEIFAFMRKHEDEEYAYLVAMNIGSEVKEEARHLDFTSVWPEIPEKGLLYTMAGPGLDPTNQTYQYERDTHIHMTDITLHPFQGLVVELNLAPPLPEGKDAWECQYCKGE